MVVGRSPRSPSWGRSDRKKYCGTRPGPVGWIDTELNCKESDQCPVRGKRREWEWATLGKIQYVPTLGAEEDADSITARQSVVLSDKRHTAPALRSVSQKPREEHPSKDRLFDAVEVPRQGERAGVDKNSMCIISSRGSRRPGNDVDMLWCLDDTVRHRKVALCQSAFPDNSTTRSLRTCSFPSVQTSSCTSNSSAQC